MNTSFEVLLGGELLQLLVVPALALERLLEDGRIRRHADDGVLLHQLRERARLEHLAGQRVDPDALPALGQLVQS